MVFCLFVCFCIPFDGSGCKLVSRMGNGWREEVTFYLLAVAVPGSSVCRYSVILDTRGLGGTGLPDLCLLAVSRRPQWQATETLVNRLSYPTANKLLHLTFSSKLVWTKLRAMRALFREWRHLTCFVSCHTMERHGYSHFIDEKTEAQKANRLVKSTWWLSGFWMLVHIFKREFCGFQIYLYWTW